jgi:hypothetical protein
VSGFVFFDLDPHGSVTFLCTCCDNKPLEAGPLPFGTQPPCMLCGLSGRSDKGERTTQLKQKKIRAETCLGLMYMKGHGGGGEGEYPVNSPCEGLCVT